MAQPQTDRVRVRRVPERGHYDRQTVHEILDAGFVCHLGYVVDGQPYVVPTLYGRDGDSLILHGSSASRALRTGATLPVCVTVTHVDGIVLARSLFHHSANYRSVVVIGQAVEVADPDEKLAALVTLTDHVVPGRSAEARAPNAKELRATSVLRLPLDESSAKVRSGPPSDDEADYDLDVWAGVIPVSLSAGEPVPDSRLAPSIRTPASVRAWSPALERLDRRDVG